LLNRGEAGGLQQVAGDPAAAGEPAQLVPLWGRGPDHEGLGGLVIDAAGGDHGPGLGPVATLPQGVPVVRGGELVHPAEVGVGRPGGLRRAPGAWAQRDPRPFGEVPQGLREGHLVIVHHEVEHVTGSPAGMALVERVALVGDDGQRRRMVIVKRAEPDVLTTLGPQRNVLADQRDQIRRFAYSVDIRIRGQCRPTLSAESMPRGQCPARSRIRAVPLLLDCPRISMQSSPRLHQGAHPPWGRTAPLRNQGVAGSNRT
jgi:hypothetical protein